MNLAELESEALLLGIWRNVEDLEEALNIHELKAILDAARQQRHEDRRFTAALKGIDLDEGEKQRNQERLEQIQRRVQAKLYGLSEQKLENHDLGFDFELEEEE